MLTKLMMKSLEDLALEFTTSEVMDLVSFLKMVQSIRSLDDGALNGLSLVLEDRGNPNRWNIVKVVHHEIGRRAMASRTELGRRMANVPSDDPSWQQSPWKERLAEARGTMVPPRDDFPPNGIYRPTKPQPGDE